MSTLRALVRLLLAAFFAVAGVLHFTMTDAFATIVPPALPFYDVIGPDLIVQITGVMEIAFAAGLLHPATRRATGWALAAYLLAVLPANIYMAMERIPLGGQSLSDAVLWGRVALQFPLIAVVVWSTEKESRLLL